MPMRANATERPNHGQLDHVLPIEEVAQTLEQYIDHSSFWAPDSASPSTKEVTQALKDIVLSAHSPRMAYRGA